jgi:hypothetical protein
VARAKDTTRADARRRYRDSQRVESDPVHMEDELIAPAPVTSGRPSFRLPDIRGDIRALPSVIRTRPLVLIPFAMLLVAFLLELVRQSGALPTGVIGDAALLYIQLTLPPTALFIFFIGGFLAPRASWLVGGLLGAFDALLITALVLINPQAQLEGSGVSELAQGLVPLWGIAIVVGVLAASFAAWYRSFLRSSQERAKANRAAREREQALAAKEQAKKDKAAARQASSRSRSS